ncbi:MAG: DUF4139 domain-containing protein [bacterium]|nr:DUF4139 domain-containing protein [bacterium]
MKKFVLPMLLAGLLTCTAAAFAEDMPVNSVILSTSGLANFEHRAKVDGNSKLEFPVRFEQVDDILKSLIVFDKSGRLGGVTLPGKQPLAQVFKDLPFTQEQLSNPAALLNAYQGAEVKVTGEELKATGKLLQVVPEEVALGEDKTTTRNRISIMTDDGIKSALLENLESVAFTDEKIRAEVARALSAIRENGTAERRVLSVNLLGEGNRDVTLSYVVDAPLWKTAYRLVVPQAGQTKGMLQGWAVIENMTASDWANVDLTLVSGNPVTFRQNLYESYYVQRPEIPVQVFGRVMPRVDQGTVATAGEMEAPQEADGAREERDDMPKGRLGMLRKQMSPMASSRGGPGAGGAMMAMDMASAAPASAPMLESSIANIAQTANAAQSSEATTQVLFRFPDRFDLKSGQSMMLPFLSREVPMERVSLYQPETHPTHPLAAVEIKNDGETGLPPGVLTLYEESDLLKGTAFVGDAQLSVLPQGDKRMVSYALDSKTTIDRTDKSNSTEGQIAVESGILRIAVKNIAETTYTVKAPPKEARTVVIEHPKMYDYQLVTPDPKATEVSGERYRIRVEVKAGEKAVVPVKLENTAWQSYSLDSLNADYLMTFAGKRGQLDAGARKQFETLAAKRREMEAIDIKINELDQRRNQIFNDQERIRENLQSLTEKSEVKQKYLNKLNEQEDKIAGIDAEKESLSAQRLQRQQELAELIAKVKI